MASSSMVFAAYAPSTPLAASARFEEQLRVWLPVLLAASIFAVESTSYLGADHTSAPLRRLAELLCGHGVDAHWISIHHCIRKTGHFMGYGIFSLICFRGFWITLRTMASRLLRRLNAHGLAILITFAVASADEIHQSFLPNRTGCFDDVLLDTCGAVAIGMLLFIGMQAVAWLHRSPSSAVCCLEPAT